MATESSLRDRVVTTARDALLAYGRGQDAFTRRICRCDDPACLYREPTTFPLHLLLQEVARQISAGPAVASPLHPPLRDALIALGDEFALFRCVCQDPECPTTSARTGTLAELADTVFLQWYGLSGTVARDEDDDRRAGVEIAIRNLHTVAAWTARVRDVDAARLAAAAEAYVPSERSSWRHEAKILATESLDEWVPAPLDQDEVRGALEHVLLVAETSGWARETAATLLLLVNDALLALLTRDLADPLVTDALYAAMDPLVPVHALRLDVLAGATGAPPGFFRA
jgi:hypothetical protein